MREEQNAELSIRNDRFRFAENLTVDEVAIAGETLSGSGAPVIAARALLQNMGAGATSLGPLTSDALPPQPNPRDWTARSFFFSYRPADARRGVRADWRARAGGGAVECAAARTSLVTGLRCAGARLRQCSTPRRPRFVCTCGIDAALRKYQRSVAAMSVRQVVVIGLSWCSMTS